MKEFLFENGVLFLTIIMLLFISVMIQMVIAYYMTRLVNESKELEEGNTKLLREWMEEYMNNEREITNIPVFVEKNIYGFQIKKFTILQMKHISGQLLLLAVFLSGVGVCKEIIGGKTLGQILPFYIVCLLGLYFHFLLSGFIDMEEKKKSIQRNVVDFLENKKPYLYKNREIETQECVEEIKDFFGEKEEQELREILKELLA